MKMEAIRHIQPQGLDGMKNALREVNEEWLRQLKYHNGNADQVSAIITYTDQSKRTMSGIGILEELTNQFSRIAIVRLI